jgi:hypothetical protein
MSPRIGPQLEVASEHAEQERKPQAGSTELIAALAFGQGRKTCGVGSCPSRRRKRPFAGSDRPFHSVGRSVRAPPHAGAACAPGALDLARKTGARESDGHQQIHRHQRA